MPNRGFFEAANAYHHLRGTITLANDAKPDHPADLSPLISLTCSTVELALKAHVAIATHLEPHGHNVPPLFRALRNDHIGRQEIARAREKYDVVRDAMLRIPHMPLENERHIRTTFEEAVEIVTRDSFQRWRYFHESANRLAVSGVGSFEFSLWPAWLLGYLFTVRAMELSGHLEFMSPDLSTRHMTIWVGMAADPASETGVTFSNGTMPVTILPGVVRLAW